MHFYEGSSDSCINVLKGRKSVLSNMYMGFSYNKLNKKDTAAICFLKEYKLNKWLPDSVKQQMVKFAVEGTNLNSTISQLVYLDEFKPLIPNGLKSKIYFLHGSWVDYLLTFLEDEVKFIISWHFIISLLVVLMWVTYLVQLDVFQKENLKYGLITILFSAFLSEIVPIVYDYYRYYLEWNLNGQPLHDLLYSIFGIGLLEETSKFIPLLFLMAFTKEPDESYDYIFYFSISALGFALMENSMYFNLYDSPTIILRTFTSTMAHVFFSSLIGYGIMYAGYTNRNKVIWGVLFFLLSIISHGLYDYLLFFNLRFLFYLCFFMSIMIWFIMVNNALNISSFFNVVVLINQRKIERVFVYFILVILVSQYLLDLFVNKDSDSVLLIWYSVGFSICFLIFFVNRISKIDLVRGYIRPLTLRDHFNTTGNSNLFDFRVLLVNFFMINSIAPKNYYGIKTVFAHNPTIANNVLPPGDSLNGLISTRVKVNYSFNEKKQLLNTDFFWLNLSEIININDSFTNVLLVKQFNTFESIQNGLPIDIVVYLIEIENGVIPDSLHINQLTEVGYAHLSLEVANP